jgi:hypothetical protein
MHNKKQPRVHLVPTGTISSSYTPPPKLIPLRLAPRFLGGPRSTKFPMHQMIETFKVYGVQGSPARTGATNGEPHIVARRPLKSF